MPAIEAIVVSTMLLTISEFISTLKLILDHQVRLHHFRPKSLDLLEVSDYSSSVNIRTERVSLSSPVSTFSKIMLNDIKSYVTAKYDSFLRLACVTEKFSESNELGGQLIASTSTITIVQNFQQERNISYELPRNTVIC